MSPNLSQQLSPSPEAELMKIQSEREKIQSDTEVRLAETEVRRAEIQLQRDEMKFEMLRESIKDNVSDELREFLRMHNFEDLLTRLYKKLGVRTLDCLDLITTEQV